MNLFISVLTEVARGTFDAEQSRRGALAACADEFEEFEGNASKLGQNGFIFYDAKNNETTLTPKGKSLLQIVKNLTKDLVCNWS